MSFRGSDSENEEIELASPGSYDDDSVGFISKEKSPRAESKKKRRGIVLIASSAVAFLVLIGVIVILATVNRAVVAAERKEKEELANYAAAANATLSRMNFSANPCTDFYEFACGGWIAKNEIPSDKTRWGSFMELRQKTLMDTSEIIKGHWPVLTPFWESCMDLAAIERTGLAPLQALLLDAEGFRFADKEDAPRRMAELSAPLTKAQVGVVFGFGLDFDSKKPSEMILNLEQGGLSVRIREFYLQDSYATTRQTYLTHVSNILRLVGEPNPDKAAASVLALETALANISRPAADRRDPEKSFNLVTLAELRHLTRGVFDWARYFDLLDVPDAARDRIIVRDVDFFGALPDVLTYKQANREALSSYFRFRLTISFSSHLPEAFRNESFAISKLLYGVSAPAPRDQVCASLVDSNLGELIGRLYVLHHFPRSAVLKARSIIENVERAFEATINATSWLDKNTSALALGKLRAIANKVGYPDKWEDYSEVQIHKDALLSNLMTLRYLSHTRDIALLNGTVPRYMWLMNAHTVNAYYNPSWNEIVITAGILQPPFFDPDWPDALNYGAIGTVIGHELTHGFDDEGRKYDKDGVLREWWPKPVVDAYVERAKCTEKVYETYTVKVGNETLHPNGALTLGENIADCGGLKSAYYAWRSVYDAKSREEQAKDQTAAKKFFKLENADQLFFVGFAQRDCEKMRTDALRIQLASDPHSPGYARVLGPASNSVEFNKVFGCPVGSPMNPADKCSVW